MGIALPLFAVAFNALLWLGRLGLSPRTAAVFGSYAGWLVALAGPLALVGIMWRLRLSDRQSMLLVASTSAAIAALGT